MAAVRTARAQDLPALQAIEERCFGPVRAFPPAILRRAVASPRQWVGLAEAGGGAAGFVVLRRYTRTGRILDLAVLPERRRQGLGAALVVAAEGEAGRAGLKAMVLEADLQEDGLVRFYEGLGYRVVGQLPHYYGAGRHGARMVKPLG